MHQARAPARPRAPDLRARRASGAARLSAAPPVRRHCVALADVSEDFVAALEHKNPKVKLCTIRLLQARPSPRGHASARARAAARASGRAAPRRRARPAAPGRPWPRRMRRWCRRRRARPATPCPTSARRRCTRCSPSRPRPARWARSTRCPPGRPSSAGRAVRLWAGGAAAAGVIDGRMRAASGQAGRRAAKAPGGAVGDRAHRRRRADHQPDRHGARGRPRCARPHARPRAAHAGLPRPRPDRARRRAGGRRRARRAAGALAAEHKPAGARAAGGGRQEARAARGGPSRGAGNRRRRRRRPAGCPRPCRTCFLHRRMRGHPG